MSSALNIDGKMLHPIKEATKHVSYSRDYITRLAREQKIIATYVGRQWFVDLTSLKNYFETSLLEQDIRKRQLSEERTNELRVREAAARQSRLQSGRAKSFHRRALVTASLVLCFGVMTGLGINQLTSMSGPATEPEASFVHPNPRTSVAAVSKAATDTEYGKKESDAGVSVKKAEELRTVTPHFVQEIKKLPLSSEGVLLLPSYSVEQVSAKEFFSDEVKIRNLADGKQVAVIVDQEGKPVGREIPLVLVPVGDEKDNI